MQRFLQTVQTEGRHLEDAWFPSCSQALVAKPNVLSFCFMFPTHCLGLHCKN